VIWVYSKPWARLLFPEDLLDSDKPYDAFISYSHHDANYVNQVNTKAKQEVICFVLWRFFGFNRTVIDTHRGTLRTMYCRLCSNCYGTGQ
jgi:hypothetical protein